MPCPYGCHLHACFHRLCRLGFRPPAHAHSALATCAYARAQKPRCMAAISAIAGKGIHVPAYAGCISRLLAPKVARPSRRPWSALQLHAPASRRVPHSVSQPTPPQSTSEPAADPRRHGLSNSVAPAARKRSASAAAGACCAVTLRTAPSPLRAAPSAVFPRAPQAPYQGLALQREEKNEKNAPQAIQLPTEFSPRRKLRMSSR